MMLARAAVRALTPTMMMLAFAAPAMANDYLATDGADWFAYDNGQESRQLGTDGTWQLWGNFAGLGDTWIYTWTDNNWWAVWNGQTYQILPAIDQLGQSRTVELQTWGRATVSVAEVGGSLTTPAGSFSNVSRVDFRYHNLADAGTTSIWIAKDVGVVQWTEQSFAGPRTRQLTQAFVGGDLIPPPTTTTVTQPGRLVAPTEHADMETILWGCTDTYLVTDTYVDAWAGLHGSGVTVECAVDSDFTAAQVRYEMNQAGTPLDEVEFLVVALDSLWMRDYGPIILKDTNTGERQVADLLYYPGRARDDRFPRAYAQYKGMPVVRVDLYYEGGNFMTDGAGRGMSSQGVLWFNNESRSSVERKFRLLGCDDMTFFEPLVDEGTTHIDMFARIMNDRDALVSRYPSGHRQARVVDAAARTLQTMGYRVTRVDADTSHDEYATYANSVLANGVALIPQYRSSSRNRAALQAYESLGYRAVGIDSSLIIQYGGATHCASMQIPAGN